MLLAVDIGNTNIVFGLIEKESIDYKWRINTDSKRSADDYAVDMVEFFLTNKIDCLKISGCIIASVVPSLSPTIILAVKKFLSEEIEIKLIGENIFPKIEILLQNKQEIGHDRLVNAIAGYKKFGGNLIIIDFGTATTFDIVGSCGEYLGGVISPGVNLSLKALSDMTAKLPRISLRPQKNVIGKTTIEAMNSGVYFGYQAMISGMVEKIEQELGYKTTKIITGGLAEVFKDALKSLNVFYEPNLTIEGLAMVFYHSNPKRN